MIRWAPLASAYAVSTAGDVWSFRYRRLVAPHPHRGYLRVSLTLGDGRRVWRKVHALVLEAFVGPRPTAAHHGAHGDRDPTNNQLGNLRWALPVENEADKRRHGTHRNGRARRALSPTVVTAIRAEAACGASFSAIGRALGLHRSSVSRIVRGTRHRGPAGARQDVPGGPNGRTDGDGPRTHQGALGTGPGTSPGGLGRPGGPGAFGSTPGGPVGDRA